MKKKVKLMLTMVLLIFVNSKGFTQESFSSPLEYMNYINEQYEELTNDQWAYTKAVANDKSAKKIENKRQELLKTNKAAQLKIAKLPSYDGSTAYRDSVVSFLKLNYNVLNYDYGKIMDLEEVAEQSYDMMEAYLLAQEIAGEKIRSASEMLNKVQNDFAKKHNITLLESQNKKVAKLQNASKVYKYYNKAYLIFFKAYKQEVYLLDAINKGDLSAMEQNKNALSEYSNEGLNLLKSIKMYEGDNSLKQACVDILTFYKEEADKHSPKIIDFYLKKEKFESIKKAFDAKKPKQRTKEDVDQFNAAVKEYNEATNKFNAINEFLNKGRAKALNNWNNTSSKFTKKHV